MRITTSKASILFYRAVVHQNPRMTNRHKIIELKKDMERYDDYMRLTPELTLMERVRISKEIVRLSNIQDKLLQMRMWQMNDPYHHGIIETPSKINNEL